ncbi:MAG: 3-dehydroquinate synthase [Actinomycetota bacterium]
MSDIRSVEVRLPHSSYRVLIGSGALRRAPELVAGVEGREIAVVVTHDCLRAQAEPLLESLGGLGLKVEVLTVEPGEGSKSPAKAGELYSLLARLPLHRADLLVAFGGGVVGDLTGFVAATYLRGVDFLQAPTTLLAMTDAAVGGKTGVNLPEGKNLVGAFHQPVGVLADLDTLESLPRGEFVSGLAEVAKHGFIRDGRILDLLAAGGGRADPAAALRGCMGELIERSVAVKARIVEADEREAGVRMLLNYGHTLAHALERMSGFRDLRHGEAVSLGMVFAARLSEELGLARPGLCERHKQVLEALGLPTGGLRLDADAVLAAWQVDKKYRAGVRLVLLEDVGSPVVCLVEDGPTVRAALAALAE